MSIGKLRLLWIVQGREDTLWERFPGGSLGPEREGRRRGPARVMERRGSDPGGPTLGPVVVSLRRFEGSSLLELRLEWDPGKRPNGLGRMWAGWLRHVCGGAVDRCWVERVDVTCDTVGDRYRLRFDTGRHLPNLYGVTARGPQTESAGYAKGSKRKGRLYDKQAERLAAGAPDPGAVARFELECWGPFEVVGESEPRPVRLSELESIAWPCPESWCVRQFVLSAWAFEDSRYALLAAAATAYGIRFARVHSRWVFSGNRDAMDRVEYVCWPEVDPSPREAFASGWAAAVEAVRADLLDVPAWAVLGELVGPPSPRLVDLTAV